MRQETCMTRTYTSVYRKTFQWPWLATRLSRTLEIASTGCTTPRVREWKTSTASVVACKLISIGPFHLITLEDQERLLLLHHPSISSAMALLLQSLLLACRGKPARNCYWKDRHTRNKWQTAHRASRPHVTYTRARGTDIGQWRASSRGRSQTQMVTTWPLTNTSAIQHLVSQSSTPLISESNEIARFQSIDINKCIFSHK